MQETAKITQIYFTDKKGSKTMAEQNTPVQENLAYIDKETREAAKSDPKISEISKAVLEAAKDIMDKVADAGLTTTSQTRDKSKTYTDSMAVRVEPAVRFNKETGENEAMVHKDGSPIYKATAEIKHNGTKLTLFAKEDVSEGAKFTSMAASKWDRPKDSSPQFKFYKQNEIAKAYINQDIKKIAAFIQDNGFIAEKKEPQRIQSELRNLAYEANMYFKDNGMSVIKEDGEPVQDAWAKHIQNGQNETVQFRNHQDNVLVEVGFTQDGKRFAQATNFDINENGEARADGERPAKAFINTADDIQKYIACPEIGDMVAKFKGLDEKEQEQNKKKANVERD